MFLKCQNRKFIIVFSVNLCFLMLSFWGFLILLFLICFFWLFLFLLSVDYQCLTISKQIIKKKIMSGYNHRIFPVFSFPKLLTVICYLLFVTQKIHLCKLSTVNCNAKNRFWKLLYCYIVTPGVNWHGPRNRNSSSCFKNPKPNFPFQKL